MNVDVDESELRKLEIQIEIWDEEERKRVEEELKNKNNVIIPLYEISSALQSWPPGLSSILHEYACDYQLYKMNKFLFSTWGTSGFFDECDRGIPVTRIILPARLPDEISPGQISVNCKSASMFYTIFLVPSDFNLCYCQRKDSLLVTAYGWKIASILNACWYGSCLPPSNTLQ
jgi:hypothetical protein